MTDPPESQKLEAYDLLSSLNRRTKAMQDLLRGSVDLVELEQRLAEHEELTHGLSVIIRTRWGAAPTR